MGRFAKVTSDALDRLDAEAGAGTEESEETPAAGAEAEAAGAVDTAEATETTGTTDETPAAEGAPEGEAESTAETAAEGDEPEAPAATEEQEDDLFDLPEGGKFAVPIGNGETKVYSGKALADFVRRGRDYDRKAQEWKAKEERWQTEREEAVRKAVEADRNTVYRDLVKANVYVQGDDGRWYLNPALKQGAEAPAAAAAKPGPSKVARITREALGEDAEFVPQAVIDHANSLAELVEKQAEQLARFEQERTAERTRVQRETKEQEAQRIVRETHEALASHPVLSRLPKPAQHRLANAFYSDIASGYDGGTKEWFESLAGELAGGFGSPAAAHVNGNDGAPAPTASGLKPPPKKKAPPAAGGAARRPSSDPTKPKAPQQPGPAFGTREGRERTLKLIEKRLGG